MRDVRAATARSSEKLKSLQVLRHIMMTKKKKYEEIRQERCAAHDNKTEEFTKNMAEKLKSLT